MSQKTPPPLKNAKLPEELAELLRDAAGEGKGEEEAGGTGGDSRGPVTCKQEITEESEPETKTEKPKQEEPQIAAPVAEEVVAAVEESAAVSVEAAAIPVRHEIVAKKPLVLTPVLDVKPQPVVPQQEIASAEKPVQQQEFVVRTASEIFPELAADTVKPAVTSLFVAEEKIFVPEVKLSQVPVTPVAVVVQTAEIAPPVSVVEAEVVPQSVEMMAPAVAEIAVPVLPVAENIRPEIVQDFAAEETIILPFVPVQEFVQENVLNVVTIEAKTQDVVQVEAPHIEINVTAPCEVQGSMFDLMCSTMMNSLYNDHAAVAPVLAAAPASVQLVDDAVVAMPFAAQTFADAAHVDTVPNVLNFVPAQKNILRDEFVAYEADMLNTAPLQPVFVQPLFDMQNSVLENTLVFEPLHSIQFYENHVDIKKPVILAFEPAPRPQANTDFVQESPSILRIIPKAV